MSVLVNDGRVAIAESLGLRPIHVAWGTGDGSWETPSAESSEAAGLLNEVGRRIASTVQYCTPDPGGPIELPSGNFSVSLTPTKFLHIVCDFDFADAPSSVIREFGVFVGTETDAQLPPGQEYFSGAEVTSPGLLLLLENVVPIFRSPAIRETAQFVINF